jgi:hypothetical protein
MNKTELAIYMSFENRTLGGNIYKIHVFIREAIRTIATLFNTRLTFKNRASYI